MKLSLYKASIDRLRTDLAVVVVDPDTTLCSVKDAELGRVLNRIRKGFKEDRLKREVFHSFGSRAPVQNLLVFSTSLSKSFNVWENVKIFAARSLGYARDYGLKRIAFLLNHKEGAPFVGKVVEGYVLGGYRFDKYKSKKTKDEGLSVNVVIRPEDLEASKARLERYKVVSEEINACRDIVNEPGAAVYPDTMARAARRIATKGNLECTILNEKQLEKQGYTGLIEVGKGSVHPPRMIILRYKPTRRATGHLALVGKGITFDTGGLSLKPSEGMEAMKGDMAGAGAVLYAMAAISRLKPAARVTGIIATAENFPGPKAQRPGDIFIAKNGKSIVVDNTDAEGRLVLTDAFYRAKEERATHIVDIATLTGACVRALGTSMAGIMGNNPALVQAVIQSGQNHGETFWELPLPDEYKEMLKTPYADINNIGGKYAGAITAGLFLQEFVPEGAAWAHLDIAGPFIIDKKWKYYTEGATAFGLKTMVDLAEHFKEYLG
jgi:leucyl aminopeptidase